MIKGSCYLCKAAFNRKYPEDNIFCLRLLKQIQVKGFLSFLLGPVLGNLFLLFGIPILFLSLFKAVFRVSYLYKSIFERPFEGCFKR